ncbi:MAG: phage terminase large subunit, partial [Chloroflexota bacterium]
SANTRISMPQDPGQAGKDQVAEYVKMLAGYNVTATPESGDKVTRFGGFSSQARAGNVDILRGDWNEDYFSCLELFPEGGLDDGDATSRAFQALTQTNTAALDFLRNEVETNQRREASEHEADRKRRSGA